MDMPCLAGRLHMTVVSSVNMWAFVLGEELKKYVFSVMEQKKGRTDRYHATCPHSSRRPPETFLADFAALCPQLIMNEGQKLYCVRHQQV